MTSHFLELVPVIIIQKNRKALHVYTFSFECKPVVKENVHLKRKEKMCSWHRLFWASNYWGTLTWSSIAQPIAQEACASFLHLHVPAELFKTQNVEKKWMFDYGEHTPVKAKWCNFIILCLVVLYIYVNIYIYQSESLSGATTHDF